MSEEDIRDPRVVPRWLPVGIHGVPRNREWDAVLVVELPELEDAPAAELALRLLPDGEIVVHEGDALPAPVARRVAGELSRVLDGPGEALLVRRGVSEWSLAVRAVRLGTIALPALPGVEEVAVALSPDGERVVFVDGEEVDPAGELVEAADMLETAGSREHRAFVARASRSAGGWSCSVDPL